MLFKAIGKWKRRRRFVRPSVRPSFSHSGTCLFATEITFGQRLKHQNSCPAAAWSNHLNSLSLDFKILVIGLVKFVFVQSPAKKFVPGCGHFRKSLRERRIGRLSAGARTWRALYREFQKETNSFAVLCKLIVSTCTCQIGIIHI